MDVLSPQRVPARPEYSQLARSATIDPAAAASNRPGFNIKIVWYLSVGSQLLQAGFNLLLLRRELHRKLKFDDGPDFIPASATAS